MSMYPSDERVPVTTPIFDETVTSTDVHLDPSPMPMPMPMPPAADHGSQAADTAKDAAGAAKDTVKEAAGQAKEQAQQVGAAATDAARQVGETTKDQASRVASDAVGQARELYGQASEQLSEQAGKQKKNAASTLHTFSEDLSKMHDQDDNGGLAAELVQSLSQRAGLVADWLEQREPGEVLEEVKQFAARRPGLFIGLAAVTGIVAARAVKALPAEAHTSEPSASASSRSRGASDLNDESSYSATFPSASGDVR